MFAFNLVLEVKDFFKRARLNKQRSFSTQTSLTHHGAVLVHPHQVERLAAVMEPDHHLLRRRRGSRRGHRVTTADARAVIVLVKVVAVQGKES